MRKIQINLKWLNSYCFSNPTQAQRFKNICKSWELHYKDGAHKEPINFPISEKKHLTYTHQKFKPRNLVDYRENKADYDVEEFFLALKDNYEEFKVMFQSLASNKYHYLNIANSAGSTSLTRFIDFIIGCLFWEEWYDHEWNYSDKILDGKKPLSPFEMVKSCYDPNIENNSDQNYDPVTLAYEHQAIFAIAFTKDTHNLPEGWDKWQQALLKLLHQVFDERRVYPSDSKGNKISLQNFMLSLGEAASKAFSTTEDNQKMEDIARTANKEPGKMKNQHIATTAVTKTLTEQEKLSRVDAAQSLIALQNSKTEVTIQPLQINLDFSQIYATLI